MFGWLLLCEASWWPSLTTRRAAAALFAAFCPRLKNVALTPLSFSTSRIRPVYWLGPSSNVSAITLRPAGRGLIASTTRSTGCSITPLSTSFFEERPTHTSRTPSLPVRTSRWIEPPEPTSAPCGTGSCRTSYPSVTSPPDVTVTVAGSGNGVPSNDSAVTGEPFNVTVIGSPPRSSTTSPVIASSRPGLWPKSLLSASNAPSVVSTRTLNVASFTRTGTSRQW